MTVEFFPDMDILDYHARRDVLSKSMLSEGADCWARFKYLYIDGGAPKKTKSLRIGSAIHTLALEPEKWKAEYYILPEFYIATSGKNKGEKMPMRRDERMDVYKDCMREAGDRLILSKEEHQQVEGMAEAIVKDKFALSLLKSPGYVESSIFWQEEEIDEETGEVKPGLKFRCRPDLMRNDRLIVDLKSARSVKQSVFMKDAWNLHYDVSAALTSRGYEAMFGVPPDEYVFLAVEPDPPYLLNYFSSREPMTDFSALSYLDVGQSRLATLLEQYKKCVRTNTWPGYADRISPMQVPGYMMKNIERGES